MYSATAKRWKISDFGFLTEAPFTAATSSEDARGTPSYQAPELVCLSGSPTFTKKSDIWGLGCILYGLAVRDKAFADDFHVYSYRKTLKAIRVPLEWTVELETKPYLTNLIGEMLQVEPENRPTAQDLHTIFEILVDSKSLEDDKIYLPLSQKMCQPLSPTESDSAKCDEKTLAPTLSLLTWEAR